MHSNKVLPTSDQQKSLLPLFLFEKLAVYLKKTLFLKEKMKREVEPHGGAEVSTQ